MAVSAGQDGSSSRSCRHVLVVITGPTASGKTALAIEVAGRLGCDILSADSRQLFRDLPIGTAAPTEEERAAVPHHFIATLGLADYYSAARYEEDALGLLDELWSRPGAGPFEVVCGGSMMYLDALVRGIDDMPTITDATRSYVRSLHEQHGMEGLLAQLELLDPQYAGEVDRANTRRVMHALEICLQSGRPYSEFRTGGRKDRPFTVLKFALELPREELFARIGARVRAMVEAGLVEEARRAFGIAGEDANSLNTVGYRELHDYFSGEKSLEEVVEKIARNTRVYAKKQLTWLRRDPSVVWLEREGAADAIVEMALRAAHE
ncbi:MAG: tRNA (adenosine(37)-N6)-dimethylallyltransferase MiaA [Muribaculaceae bacterium]|nr:tRNA (adenosine(37)-N6)-dimethylallyltransferase MiaA [Muribaculaceae bacterium]